MILKSILYEKQQNELCDKVIEILELDENNSFVLYDLDNDQEKIDKIMALIPDFRKYFSFKNIVGIEDPEKLKRPYMSIIRGITKLKYNFSYKDHQRTIDGKKHRTQRYIFTKK